MNRAPKTRSFWQYNKDNKMIFAVWGTCLLLGIASIGESLGMAIAFFGVGVLALIASLIDWYRKG